MKLYAGAGIATIKVQELLPLEQFTTIHDDLHVRVLFLQGASKQLIVSWELTSIRDYEIKRCKELLMKRYDLAYDAIWMCVTHTFLAPHTRSANACKDQAIQEKNEAYCACLEAALCSACDMAIQNLQEVVITYGVCTDTKINVNRDILTAQGWWLGQNPKGFSDHFIHTIGFWTKDQKLHACLSTCDVSSAVLEHVLAHDGTRIVTSDFIGEASKQIEEHHPHAVAIFLMGAAGNQTTCDKAKDEQTGFAMSHALGTKLATAITQVLHHSCPISFLPKQTFRQTLMVPGQRPPADLHALNPSTSYTFVSDQDQEVQYEIWTFDDLVMIALQPELYSESAVWLKQHSPYPITLVFTMVNGGAKYMAPKEAYEHMTYEAMNSRYAKGACEQVLETICTQLQTLRQKEGCI